MKCPSKLELSAYFDGEVSPGRLGEIKQHVDNCRSCNRELDELGELVRTVGQLSELPLQVPIPGTILAPREIIRYSKCGKIGGWKPGLAIVLLLCVIGLGMGMYWHQANLSREYARQVDYFVAEHEIVELLHTINYGMYAY